MYLLTNLETSGKEEVGTSTTEDLSDQDYQEADDGILLIVNLENLKRYVGPEEWVKIEGKY